MRLLQTFTMVVLLAVAGCATAPTPASSPVFDRLLGQWDERGESLCESPHVLSFDETKATMLITYADVGWASESDSRKTFRYKILDVAPSSIRVALENESRLDSNGEPVVWHIVIVDDDTYCWGRDDWPIGACTPFRKRCGI